MRVSQIGLISTKITKLDEQFPVQDMLLKTGQLEQFVSGVYAYGHIPYLLKKNIVAILSRVFAKYDCSELSLPILQPEKIWSESGRLDKYVSDGVMFQSITKNGNFCLAPTAEEAVVYYAKQRLTTYKQLPVTYFQVGEKFRNEIRTRGYLLRGRAFDMFDAYSFGRDKDDLDREYERMKQAYQEFFEELDLKVQPVGADSGAIGGSKSEEFMLISDIGEDNILFDPKTGKAFNSELLDRDDYEGYLKTQYGIENTKDVITKKAVELGHIFQLGEKYSKAMGATYIGKDGKEHYFVMGCYGIGVSRTLAMVYEQSAIMRDGKFDGIVLPKKIAPYLLYVIPKVDDKEKFDIAENFYIKLKDAGVGVLFDDRQELSIGAKIKDSRIVGCPYTVVFGRTLDNGLLEIEDNKTGEKFSVKIEDFVEMIVKLSK